MKFIRMVLANCKKHFKDYKNVICMFIIPIVCVTFVTALNNDAEKGLNIKVGIINLDKGKLSTKFIKELGVNTVYYNKSKALKELKNYNQVALYEIPKNFTQQINKDITPHIDAYKLEEGNSTQTFEAQIQEKLNNMVKVNILKSNNIIKNQKELDKNLLRVQYNLKKGLMSSEGFLSIMLIMFFLVTFSASITTDLLKLRKEKILERFLSTNNKGYEIMGSIYLSMFIVQVTMYTASFIVMNTILKLKFENFGMLILNIALMSIVSISLGIMISRIFKEPSIAVVVMYLISMIMFFLYVGSTTDGTLRNVPKIIIALSKFTPFYWSLGSIENSKVFPNVFVLILMALVFFSAGSIKYSSFAKK